MKWLVKDCQAPLKETFQALASLLLQALTPLKGDLILAEAEDGALTVTAVKMKAIRRKEAAQTLWKKTTVDVVEIGTGITTHLNAPAKKIESVHWQILLSFIFSPFYPPKML